MIIINDYYQKYRMDYITDHDHIKFFLEMYCSIKGTYTISEEGNVSIKGDIHFLDSFNQSPYGHFPIQFDTIKGNFNCSNCQNLISLHGSPVYVMRYFLCKNNRNLMTTAGGPRTVGGDYDVSGCIALQEVAEDLKTVARWLNLKGCEQLKQWLCEGNLGGIIFDQLPVLPSTQFKKLLLSKTEVTTQQDADWIRIWKRYLKNNNLMEAASLYQKVYSIDLFEKDHTNDFSPTP